MLFPQPQEALAPETITTYAADCTTPKTIFNLGDQVCAKVDGGPSLAGTPRRFSWVNAENEIQSLATVSALPDTNVFTLTPPDPGTDWRGRWTVNSIGTRANVRATTVFFVKDADHPTVDLAVYDLINFETTGLSSETPAEFLVWVVNRGPNDATNVEVTTTGTNSTFLSGTQQIGPSPAFSCTGSGANGSCTIASLPAGATAQIRVVYQITPGAPSGTVVTNTATISNDIAESRADDNTYSSSAVVNVVGDANACLLVCPANMTVAANSTQGGTRGAIVTFNAETSGSCGAVTSSPLSGSFFPVGTTPVTISAGSDSCTFDVIVTDADPPTISCPDTVSKDAGSACSTELTEAEIGTPTASGGTGQLTIVGVRDDGAALDSPYPVGPTTITWTVTDEGSRSASCNQLITITGAADTTAPTITAPPDVTDGTGATGAACGKIVGETELGTPDTDDNCNSPVTIIRTGVPAGSFFPVGTTTITYVAKDRAGNTSAPVTQKVTITENTPPSIKAPADESYTCLEQVPAPDPSKAQHGDEVLDANGNPLPPGPPTDNCSTPVVTVSDSATGAGTASNPRIISRTYTATDSSGNSASAVQTITVIDSTLPTIAINGSSSVTVECHTSFTDPGATASDNCAGATVNVSGTVNIDAPGTYTLSYTATDAVGNTSSPVTRTVTVVDTTPPTVTLNGASSMTVECHTSFTDPGATASDSCAGTLTVTTSGSVNVNVPGTYTLTYSAQDPSGNTASQTRTVVVVDTTPPVINLNGQNISFWPPNHSYHTVSVTDLVASVTDSCDTTLDINSVVISQVTSDETENGNGDGNTLNDIVIASGCKSVQLRAERNGSGNGRVYTITFKVKDASGNIGTVTAKVTVAKSSGGSAVDDGPHYTVNGCNP